MTHDEAAKVMAVMAAAYPGADLPADRMEVWYHASLANIDAELGMAVAQRVIAEQQWFPTPALFNEVRRSIERAHEPATKALPEGEVDRGRHRRFIDECRQMLKRPEDVA